MENHIDGANPTNGLHGSCTTVEMMIEDESATLGFEHPVLDGFSEVRDLCGFPKVSKHRRKIFRSWLAEPPSMSRGEICLIVFRLLLGATSSFLLLVAMPFGPLFLVVRPGAPLVAALLRSSRDAFAGVPMS